jgi:hypothetical protein
MNCKVIHGGFNPAWQAGRLERQIIDELATRLELLYNQNLFYEYARNQKLHFAFVAAS